MEISVELPLDRDGYLRRQCSHCEREFKWLSGETEDAPREAPSREVYFCPYCGQDAASDQWYTNDQVEYMHALASQEALRLTDRELRPSIDRLNQSGGLLKASLDVPYGNPPSTLSESDDMSAVASPCHPDEPVKVLDDWAGPLHCLVCGEPYALPDPAD
jgi:hypothetical protein